MIKVLEENPVPYGTVTCPNCGSILEYGNADLIWVRGDLSAMYRSYFVCPVCHCQVNAHQVERYRLKSHNNVLELEGTCSDRDFIDTPHGILAWDSESGHPRPIGKDGDKVRITITKIE